MTTRQQIQVAERIIATGLCEQVYINCELFQRDGKTMPVYKEGNDFMYIGPTDTRFMFAYIRPVGTSKRVAVDQLSSCSKNHKLSVLHRAVFFRDHEERNFELLQKKLLAFTFDKNVDLIGTINSFQALSKLECSLGDFSFGPTTFYYAVDFNVSVSITRSDCDIDYCETIKNPICHGMLLQ